MSNLPLRHPLPESGDGLIGLVKRNEAEVDRDIALRDKELELKVLQIEQAKRDGKRDKWDYWKKYGYLGGESLWIIITGIGIGFILGVIATVIFYNM